MQQLDLAYIAKEKTGTWNSCKLIVDLVGATINKNCGHVVPSTYPWLATTPDVLVINPCASPLSLEGLINLKIHTATG